MGEGGSGCECVSCRFVRFVGAFWGDFVLVGEGGVGVWGLWGLFMLLVLKEVFVGWGGKKGVDRFALHNYSYRAQNEAPVT